MKSRLLQSNLRHGGYRSAALLVVPAVQTTPVQTSPHVGRGCGGVGRVGSRGDLGNPAQASQHQSGGRSVRLPKLDRRPEGQHGYFGIGPPPRWSESLREQTTSNGTRTNFPSPLPHRWRSTRLPFPHSPMPSDRVCIMRPLRAHPTRGGAMPSPVSSHGRRYRRDAEYPSPPLRRSSRRKSAVPPPSPSEDPSTPAQ